MKWLIKIGKLFGIDVYLHTTFLLPLLPHGCVRSRGIDNRQPDQLEVDELLELFGAFLLIWIGVELLDSVKIYITKKQSMSKLFCWWGSSLSPARS